MTRLLVIPLGLLLLLTGVLFMTFGAWIMAGAVRIAGEARVSLPAAPAQTPAD